MSMQSWPTYGNSQCAHCRIVQILGVGFDHTDHQIPQHLRWYTPLYASDAQFDMWWNTVETQLKVIKLITFHYFGPRSFSPASSTRSLPTTLNSSRLGGWITETIGHPWLIIISNVYAEDFPCHCPQMTFQGTLQICILYC